MRIHNKNEYLLFVYTVLRSLHVSTYLILTKFLHGSYYYYLNFTDEGTEMPERG